MYELTEIGELTTYYLGQGLGPGLGPELIIKSGGSLWKSGTGTQNKKIRDPGPGLEIFKSGILDWDREPELWDVEFRDSTIRARPGDRRNPGLGLGD